MLQPLSKYRLSDALAWEGSARRPARSRPASAPLSPHNCRRPPPQPPPDLPPVVAVRYGRHRPSVRPPAGVLPGGMDASAAAVVGGGRAYRTLLPPPLSLSTWFRLLLLGPPTAATAPPRSPQGMQQCAHRSREADSLEGAGSREATQGWSPAPTEIMRGYGEGGGDALRLRVSALTVSTCIWRALRGMYGIHPKRSSFPQPAPRPTAA
jgi:hypothetical protein